MRIGPSHQAGSDSLLTASTFFKLRDLYFDEEIEPEYTGKLYGLGQTVMNGMMTDPSRGGATPAEREDRSSARETLNQTPAAGVSQNQVTLGMMTMPAGALPTLPSGSYGPMGANGPYMRTSLVGGR